MTTARVDAIQLARGDIVNTLFYLVRRTDAPAKRASKTRQRHNVALRLEKLEVRAVLSTVVNLTPLLPEAINDSGQIAGGAQYLRESNGTLTSLGQTAAGLGINNLGDVVGYDNFGESALLYKANKVLDLGALPGSTYSKAVAANDFDQLVGFANGPDGRHPFLYSYSDGLWTDLSDTAGDQDVLNSALGINDSAQVVGFGYFSDGQHAYLYQSGTATELRDLVPPSGSGLGANTPGLAINDAGQVVGEGKNEDTGALNAFLFSNGGYTDLGTLPGQATSTANAINDLGQVVGTSYNSNTAFNNDSHAFLYSQGQMTDLNVFLPVGSGWVLQSATDINDHGQVIGYGTFNGLPNQTFLLNLDILPMLTLTEATTTDSHSVTVNYMISHAAITQPLTFDIYRSDQPMKDGSSQLLGSQTLGPSDDAQDLSNGNHVVRLLEGITLSIDPLMPYIVVVANESKSVNVDSASVNTVEFRKFVLGVVAHGYELTGAYTALPTWETTIADELKTIDKYNDVIAFDWLSQSNAGQPGVTIAQGQKMAGQIQAEAHLLSTLDGHPGNVVDLHLIGHSRGAVVVSQALLDLQKAAPDAVLDGGFKKLTLLDPHPANNSLAIVDYSSDTNRDLAKYVAMPRYLSFQAVAVDPQIVIPSNVNEAEIYFQHSTALEFSVFNTERYLNPWGQDPSLIVNQSQAPLYVANLTDVNYAGLGYIGHSEVPVYYDDVVVKVGKAYL